jgi:hypothetical protein
MHEEQFALLNMKKSDIWEKNPFQLIVEVSFLWGFLAKEKNDGINVI